MSMNSLYLKLLVCAILAAGALSASAQKVALKTNIVQDALLDPNIGVEVGLAPKWTLDVTGQLNAWTIGDGHRWKHWLVQPEARYWFCERFAGHFLGFHALGGQYNFSRLGNKITNFLGSDLSKLTDQRYQGWGAGAGVAYGYAWPVHKHWNVEAEIGIGWIYTRFDSFPCKDCGKKIDSDRAHNYVGPTKAALNIVYLF